MASEGSSASGKAASLAPAAAAAVGAGVGSRGPAGGGEARATASVIQKLRGRALALGAANAFDYAIQWLLPVVLVRCLSPAAFGEYRLFWLVVGTVLPLATWAMPASLYYYMPRSAPAEQRLYIRQTLVFLVVTGLVGAWAVSPWNPLLPPTLRTLEANGAVVPAFMWLWVIASLLDRLPTVDERITWQTVSTMVLSFVRAVALSLTAWITGALLPVLGVLLAFAAFKVVLMLHYISAYHGWGRPLLRRREFTDQLRYAAPVGGATTLYALRTQADQWVAAALFPLGSFASFSIASVVFPVMNLFQLSVSHAFLPSMSRHEATRNIRGMLDLNSQANVTVAWAAAPVFAFAFLFAEELVSFVYTPAYVAAAPVMRIYIVGLAALVVELSTLTMLLRLAPFVMVVNVVALALAVPLNWFFARHIGLAGAALGSVAVFYVDRGITLWKLSRHTGVPVHKLQQWRALALPAVCAALAATAAWALVDRCCEASPSLVQMFVGGGALFACYGAMYALIHLRHRLL